LFALSRLAFYDSSYVRSQPPKLIPEPLEVLLRGAERDKLRASVFDLN
jgi:hypothetical protein